MFWRWSRRRQMVTWRRWVPASQPSLSLSSFLLLYNSRRFCIAIRGVSFVVETLLSLSPDCCFDMISLFHSWELESAERNRRGGVIRTKMLLHQVTVLRSADFADIDLLAFEPAGHETLREALVVCQVWLLELDEWLWAQVTWGSFNAEWNFFYHLILSYLLLLSI